MKHAAFIGVLIAGCASYAVAAPAPQVLPPKPATIADAQPDEHGVKRMAILRGLDKISGRTTDVNAPVGVPVRFGTLTMTVRYCHTVPPEEPPETSVFVQIDDKPLGAQVKRVFSGWMFASTPALNGLEHPTYDVWPITCKTDEPIPGPPPPIASSGGPTPPPEAEPAPESASPAPAASPAGAAPAGPNP